MNEQALPTPRSIRLGLAVAARLGRDTRSMGESLRLGWFALTESITGLYWTVALLLRMIGLGSTRPAAAEMAHNTLRQLTWAGAEQLPSYQATTGPEGRQLEPLRNAVADPARARDIDWHLINPVATGAGLLVQSGVLFFGAVTTMDVVTTVAGYGFYTAIDYYLYWGSLSPIAVIGGPLALWLTPKVARLQQRLHRRWVRRRLEPRDQLLSQRLEQLTTTRRTALELQEEEIRRIERDLHDGAQARIVAMGMTLTQVQRLLEVDPDGARQLLATAKEDSSAALGELRSLVRGIRPPILADRGLTAALQSLAAGCPIEARVVSKLDERLVPTLETALYFAVTELVANAVKHSAASELVIELGVSDGWATASVTDNGIGGMREQASGGLAGLRQRLAPFDGSLDWVSPVGGPTLVSVRVPLPADEVSVPAGKPARPARAGRRKARRSERAS